jgi:putative CocE/NonD family hydrolase
MRTGWYDWGLNDALATWCMLREAGRSDVAAAARLIIAPYAHNTPGYREGSDRHPELLRVPNTLTGLGPQLQWYDAVRAGTTGSWPRVVYYLMGANEWRVAADWPVPEATELSLYLRAGGALSTSGPGATEVPENYVYDPDDPTPTVGGSIVSHLYTPGSADVSAVQDRSDVVVYTTPPLESDIDVVGPLRLVLYAGSDAVDTDWVARLSDVFPDGRAIQLQSGILRARHRDAGEPKLLVPGQIYRFDIDMWATGNRFAAGHRIRLDVSSADFPHYDRNSNLGGMPGDPIAARQTVYHDQAHPSRLVLSVLDTPAEI